MVVIRFPDEETETKALGWMAGRFSFVTYADGQTVVPESALAALAQMGWRFEVMGRPAYEQRVAALRGAVASGVQ